jgi:hypothetical protein
MTDHLLTRARRGSIADMQLCGPPRWLIKSEALAVERIRPGQHLGHTIELQIWHPTTTKTPKEETIPAIHELSTRFVFQMSSMQITICIRSWTTSQAPRRRWSKRRRNGGARGQRSTTRMSPPPRHPYLNRLVSKFIPKHRTDDLVRDGSEESLFSAVVVAAEVKTMNNLKT